MTPISPPRWTDAQFEMHLTAATAAFREERHREPVEQYRALFDDCAARIRTLLATTDDLIQAQRADLTIFWAHDLGMLGDFVDSAR